jgi:hypothetical protein
MQDAQNGDLLTRPTLARQDAPCPWQGRSDRRGEACASVPLCSAQSENEAYGFFQYPVRVFLCRRAIGQGWI